MLTFSRHPQSMTMIIGFFMHFKQAEIEHQFHTFKIRQPWNSAGLKFLFICYPAVVTPSCPGVYDVALGNDSAALLVPSSPVRLKIRLNASPWVYMNTLHQSSQGQAK